MSTSRFSLRDKATLRLLKLHSYGAYVVEWSRALNIRLSNLFCSASMVLVQIPSREEHKCDGSKIRYPLWYISVTFNLKIFSRSRSAGTTNRIPFDFTIAYMEAY